jgi:protein gp37
MTKIEWTEQSWNPIVGCSIVSPGCTNCYAMAMAARIEAMDTRPSSRSEATALANGAKREALPAHLRTVRHYDGLTRKVNGRAVWTGKLALAQHKLLEPLTRKKPTTFFVNSMGDLFHEDVPDEWILDVLTVMAIAGRHTFQVLTKRAGRMRKFMSQPGLLNDIYANWYTFDGGAREVADWPLPNVWLGVSTEDQRRYDERKDDLRATPAAVRFFSMEPLLGSIVMDYLGDWVILGGEGGARARPMHPDWARSPRDQCAAAGVPFFFKQWGEFLPHDQGGGSYDLSPAARSYDVAGAWTWRVGKRVAGRLLDGVTHDAMPEPRR